MTLSPQALQHDLMMAALFRTIHVNTINTDIQIENGMSYLMLGVRVQMNPTPFGFNGVWVQTNPTPLAPTQASIEIEILHL